MATIAITRFESIRRSGPPVIGKSTLGWVGSKAVYKADFVTQDANGYYDQAVAVSTAVGDATLLALANKNVAAASAAASAAALGFSVEYFDDQCLVELQAVDGSSSFTTLIATSAAREQDSFGLYRRADGVYVIDVNDTATPQVRVRKVSPRYPVGTVGGTFLCQVLAANRL